MIFLNKKLHIHPTDSVNTQSRIKSTGDLMLLKSKTYRYLYRNLNTNHIITRNTPHPTIINDGVDDKLPQPREITYASDLLVFVNVKKNIIKIIKNKYGDGEDSDLKIYIQRLIEMCKRSEKIKSLYDSD